MYCDPSYTPSCIKNNAKHSLHSYPLLITTFSFIFSLLVVGKAQLQAIVNPKSIRSLHKSKNKGRKHQKLTWRHYLKVYVATNFWEEHYNQTSRRFFLGTNTKLLRARRWYWCLWKSMRHSIICEKQARFEGNNIIWFMDIHNIIHGIFFSIVLHY